MRSSICLFLLALNQPVPAIPKASAVDITVPADAVFIGPESLRNVKWSRALLEEPSGDGQFEFLVRKSAADAVVAPACHQPYLLVRMPGLFSRDATYAGAVEKRKQAYAAYLEQSKRHQPIQFHLVAHDYGHINPSGKLQLSGCNVWLETP